ncbi:MAG: 23S rRNA (guanosine(2251)-2'-O)-methyltransferase RlmB [Gloeobacterales cyanobacterium]
MKSPPMNKDSKKFSKKPRPSRAGKPGSSATSGAYKRTSSSSNSARSHFKKTRTFSTRPSSLPESTEELSSDKSRNWKPRLASSSRFAPQQSSTRKPYQRTEQSTDRPRDDQSAVRKPFRRSEQESDRPRTGQSPAHKPYQRAEKSADRPRSDQSTVRKPFRRSAQESGTTVRSKWNDRGGSSRPAPRRSPNEFTIQRKPRATAPAEALVSPPEDETELLYGKQPVRSALEKGRTLNRLWITDQLRYDGRFLPLIEEAKNKGTVIDVVDRKRLDQLTQGENHQGVVAQVAAYTYWELEDLIQQSAKEPEPMLLVLDGIEDPQNLGSLIRTAEALGVNGLIIPQRRASGVTATVSRVAAGAVEHLAIARVVNLNQALERLKEAGYWVVGAEASGERSVSAIDLKGPLVVVIGSEGKGISLLTQKLCDFICHIPLRGRTPSLNAGVAGAIVLYEVSRQRATRTIKMELT